MLCWKVCSKGKPTGLARECSFHGSGFVAVAILLFALALSALGHSVCPWGPLSPSFSCCSVLQGHVTWASKSGKIGLDG